MQLLLYGIFVPKYDYCLINLLFCTYLGVNNTYLKQTPFPSPAYHRSVVVRFRKEGVVKEIRPRETLYGDGTQIHRERRPPAAVRFSVNNGVRYF